MRVAFAAATAAALVAAVYAAPVTIRQGQDATAVEERDPSSMSAPSPEVLQQHLLTRAPVRGLDLFPELNLAGDDSPRLSVEGSNLKDTASFAEISTAQPRQRPSLLGHARARIGPRPEVQTNPSSVDEAVTPNVVQGPTFKQLALPGSDESARLDSSSRKRRTPPDEAYDERRQKRPRSDQHAPLSEQASMSDTPSTSQPALTQDEINGQIFNDAYRLWHNASQRRRHWKIQVSLHPDGSALKETALKRLAHYEIVTEKAHAKLVEARELPSTARDHHLKEGAKRTNDSAKRRRNKELLSKQMDS